MGVITHPDMMRIYFPLVWLGLHVPLVHALALAVSVLRTGAIDPWLFGNHPMAPPPVPDGYLTSAVSIAQICAEGASIVGPPSCCAN